MYIKISFYLVLIMVVEGNTETNEMKINVFTSSEKRQSIYKTVDSKEYQRFVTTTNEYGTSLADELSISSKGYGIKRGGTVESHQLFFNERATEIQCPKVSTSTETRWSSIGGIANTFEGYTNNQRVTTELSHIQTQRKSEGKVSSSENCFHISVYMSVCPPNLDHLSNETLCYKIMKNQAFPPSCPYPHFLPFHQITYYLKKYFSKESLWLQALRNTSSGFPNFDWTENGSLYGQVVNETIINANDMDKNCLVYKNGNIYRVSCSENYSTLCIYSIEQLQNSNLPNVCRSTEYYECIVSNYDLLQPKCYCKKIDRAQPYKRNFCRKLIEPIFPYQTQLLLQYMKSDSRTCWFGLHKEASPPVPYKWSSTNESVSYTRWAKPEACGFSEGAIKFDGPSFHGWTLAKERTLNCAICEVAMHFQKCTLQLQYRANENEIVLSIHNFVSISTLCGLSLYCYSDSDNEDFKQTVAIIYDSAVEHKNWTILKLETVAYHPGYYWCEAFEYSSKSVTKSNIILINNRDVYGYEFSLVASVEVKVDPFINKLHFKLCQDISNHIEKQFNIVKSLRPMRAFLSETQHYMHLLMHLTTIKTSRSVGEIHKKVFNVLESISTLHPEIKITKFLNTDVCLSDITLTTNKEILQWPETKIGATTVPINTLCLDEERNMLPVTRKCKGDFLNGASWEKPIGTCSTNKNYSKTTVELFDLLNSNASANNITNDLVRITQENVNQQPIDVHLVSEVLEKLVATEEKEIDNCNFSNIISNVMNFNKSALKCAQHILNSTDKILWSLDKFMYNKQSVLLKTPRLIVQITDLQSSDVTGLALFKETPEAFNFNSYKITQLFKNTSFNCLLNKENLETAVLLPPDLLKNVKRGIAAHQSMKLIIIIFYNDLLFNQLEDSKVIQKSKSNIIGVTVPGYNGLLNSPLKMAFKMPKNYLNLKNCSYWDYGINQFMVSVYGHWETDALSRDNTNSLEICEFFHMTHFGLLLQGFPIENLYDDTALEILTVIGSSLSLIGIIPIFITAVLFKTWRSRPGNIILINFSIAITLQIILMFSMYAIEEDGVPCRIIGATYHYLVLSEFFWMFVVALLQHKRFVMVFKPQDETIVKKCLLVGWGLPLLPVVVTVSISVDNYKINSQGFCNVGGKFHSYAYIMPILIILCSNAFIFTKIIYSVSRQNTKTCAQRSRNYKLEILLALFLFFVLGMTWIFGIIGAFGGGIVFTYIFCVTATLRGLVLFLFFIIGNKETRLMWKKRSTYYMERKLQKLGSSPASNATVVSNE